MSTKITPTMYIVNQNNLFAVGDVTIDDLFVIRQVKVVSNDGEFKVFLPRKATGKGWNNIIEVTPELYGEIREKVMKEVSRIGKEFKGWAYLYSDIKVQVKPYEDGNLRGFATLTYKDIVTIKGIQIRENEKGLYLVYPYTKHGEGYENLIGSVPYCPDFFNDVKRLVLEEYTNVKTTGLAPTADAPSEGGMPR